ncbi:sigma-70 family RNA polymerase sigma factor [Myxococcus landrumensis]|uniref:Sigma-70 family RNA polymerase sigma factor n=2 Tax=Myxococcus landrumensis TaxID=2813577 RepID=A0ABX7NB41_9BACT|nr:sigma-70 family RNA polymerase sigma factor [Myxococcus landrumus]
MRYPTRAEEEALHARVLKGRADPTAPAEVHRAFNGTLIHVLRQEVKCLMDEAVDSAVDAVLAYLAAPERFDARLSRLSTYLTRIAKRKALDRQRSRKNQDRRNQEYAGVVELVARAPNEEMEATVEARLLAERLEALGFSPREQTILRLVLQGEGSTERLAEALGLGPMPEEERRRQVKRHRDRLMKRLERLGREDSDVAP